MSLSIYRPDKKKKQQLPEKLLKRPVASPRPDDPLTVPYELRGAVVLVSNAATPPGIEGKVDQVGASQRLPLSPTGASECLTARMASR